ncbi:MAG: trigger factor, partial [bacterium]|nr:trigger factor [bacterium]
MEKSDKKDIIKRAGAEVTLTVTIPAKQVSESFQRLKTQALQEVEIPGFRKGKAPQEVAEKRLDEDRLAQSLFQDLIPQAYAQTVSKEGIKPIIPPEISVKSFGKDKELVFEARTAEAPEVKLGDYRKAVSQLKGKALYGPDGKPLSEDGEATAGQVLEKLREKVEVEIPHVLVDYEVQRMLSSLVDQVRSLGMTVDQYLSSQGKKAEDVQQEYHEIAERNLK